VNKNLIKNIVLIIIPLLVIIGVGIGLVNIGVITTEPPKPNSGIINATLIIDYGSNHIDNYNIKIANATVFSVLMQASEEYNFTIGAEYYDQYRSHYIYSINSVNEENNNFWQYYLNGDYGTVGADLQPVKDNDCVEWKFQEPKI
jgi:hypothetical protein